MLEMQDENDLMTDKKTVKKIKRGVDSERKWKDVYLSQKKTSSELQFPPAAYLNC
jgi:hypothetical protein